ncbi:DNA primase [Clostridiales bacterium]|nr:DNA primase [Clostridiales bacterium]
MPLNDSFLQELKFKTDIEDIISTYVSLKRRGSTLVGLCPFHNEKTPSFTVYPETQSFYCFGCGAGGDAVGFIRKIENLDYMDAVKSLAERAGMQMPADGYDDSLSKRRRRVLEANRAAAKFFHSSLLSENGKTALSYYLNRGLTKKSITKFGLGYAPDSWDSLIKYLKSQGFTLPEMVEAGLARRSSKGSYYDYFRNRVMTPIIDVRGNVIAFGGRVLDDSKPKYINTNDTLVYKKTNEVFGLNFAKDSGKNSIILCEGYMDVISMHQAGFTNAVAGCGTALTNEQVRLICRYANEVVLAYDADEAGQKALNKAIQMFKQTDIKIRVPVLQYGKDPDEIIKTVGAEKFGGMLEGAASDLEFKILDLRKKYNLNLTQGKVDFVNDVIKIIADTSPVERDLYVSRLSDELGIEKRTFNAQLDTYMSRRSRAEKRSNYKKIVNDSIRQNARISYENGESAKKFKAEERMIYLLVKYPDCLKSIGDFSADCLTPGFMRKLFGLICENISNGADTDITNFGDKLTADECGRYSGIIARGKESANSKEEFSDCLKVISEEYNKKNSKTVSEMNDDEFRKAFGNT